MPLSRRRLRCVALPLVLGACSLLPALAQDANVATARPAATQLDQILPSLNRGLSIGQVAISPDGKRLAWFQSGEIRVAPLDDLGQSRGPQRQVLVAGVESQLVTAASPTQSCSESDFAWSPDSAALVFLSDCADPGVQMDLYLLRLDGNPSKRLTNLHGFVHDPAFSPDGTKVAFLYVEGATRPAGALAPEDLPSGVIGAEGIEIQRVAEVSIPSDWDGEHEPPPTGNQPLATRGLHLMPLFNFASPANLHVYEFDWSPDSKSLAYIASDPPGENNWWVAKLYTQSVDAPPANSLGAPSYGSAASKAEAVGWETAPTPILTPSDVAGPLHGLEIAVPRWSPDKKTIAFVGGLMSDQGVTGGDVWIVPSAGGEARDLTPGRPASAEWITWDGNGAIFVSEISGGDSQLVRLHLPATAADVTSYDSPVFSIPATVGAVTSEGSLSATADRSVFVFQASSFSTPPEILSAWGKVPEYIHSADIARIGQLSHFNDGVQPAWGRSVSLTWKNENFDVQGWLLLPAHYDPTKKYPLLVEVHGGPAAAVLSRWNGGAGGFSATAFSALDYFVLMPNPRGSFGQGEAFTQANRKDFGYGDLRDILAGVDTVLAKYPVDPNRIGLAGWSYGGFMTMFAVTQTHRFRAAVAGAGISDWLSYYGENSIDQWMIPYFGASVYDDPAVYARASAIDFIKRVSTPTLAVVGDRDGECPAPQSFEFWHALRDLHVPTQLVVYPNEGHGFVDSAHRRDVLERAVDWFVRYMPPGS
jgi:dipeptidyl aminopeptidase/acylaminoacyl peptidase